MRKAVAASFIVVGFLNPASAQDSGGEDGAWRIQEFENKSRSAVNDTVHQVRASDGEIAVAFRCQDRTLKAFIALNTEDIETDLSQAGHARDVQMEFQIGDDSGREDWGFLRRSGVVFPLRESTARKMYNAALRGETVIIDSRRTGRREVALPNIDPNIAAQFREECEFDE